MLTPLGSGALLQHHYCALRQALLFVDSAWQIIAY